MLKRNVLFFVGIVATALVGCTADYLPRPLHSTDGALFTAYLPCAPVASQPPTVDTTTFGRLRAQNYTCKVPLGAVGYVVTIGAFETPTSAKASDDEKQALNDAIASKFASDVCREIVDKDKQMSCVPVRPLHKANASVVDIAFEKSSQRFLARVHVSSPYIAASMVTEAVTWEDLKLALDVKLPAKVALR